MTGTNPAFHTASSVIAPTSTTVALGTLANGGNTAVVTNLSSGNLYIKFGTAPLTLAAGSGSLVLPNSQRVLVCPYAATNFAAILDSGSGNVYVERGTGSAR